MKKNEFVKRIELDLNNQVKHTKLSVEKLALSFGISDKNTAKELTELAIVNAARKIAKSKTSVLQGYENIVELYGGQVNLSHRTSQSMLLQQYSTPAPIGYLAGMFCKMDQPGKKGFEPSAGNGLLTIAADPKQFIVNEIDQVRNENLKTQGFSKVLKQDATLPFRDYQKKFDAVITNPPFGSMDSPIKFGDFPISVLDHVMCIRALETMKDNGRAAMIIGGHTTWDPQGRIQAGKNRIFFSYLHKHYNVLDAINIDGHKLYSRQGTAFNVRFILIDGRKSTPSGFPPLFNPEIDKVAYTFEDLYNRVAKYFDALQSKMTVTATTNILEIEASAIALELELMNFK